MQQYQFEKIFSQMANEFGKIQKGKEDMYSLLLFTIESNLLKVHRENPASNSRRLQEAIALALFRLKERYTGETFSTESFRNPDNGRLEYAMLMATDPFTNQELADAMTKAGANLEDRAFLRQYYRNPILCLLRIKDSVDFWMKQYGSDGYFHFLEGQTGELVTDNKLNFTFQL